MATRSFFASLCLILILIGYINAAPNAIFEEIDDVDPATAMNTEGMFQGDIVPEVRPRFHVKHEKRTWPDGIVYYEIDSELSKYRYTIQRAMKTIERQSCIRFKEREAKPIWNPWKKDNYIKIVNETGCWSMIGNLNRGMQKLSLGPGCRWHGIVLHELMHALGFGHMHCNQNRDKYIRVHWENIDDEKKHNFEILDPYWYEMSFFDYSSIMLYGSRSFSKDGSVTMEHPYGGWLTEPYEKGKLSNNDVYYINKVYNCQREDLRLLETPYTEYRGSRW